MSGMLGASERERADALMDVALRALATYRRTELASERAAAWSACLAWFAAEVAAGRPA